MPKRYGRYEVVRPIASGGMGTVYVARVVGAGGFERRVALKVMHPGLAVNPEFVNMFLDEARLAAGIHHPNVVSTIDVEHNRHGVYLAMDYVNGLPLDTIFDAHEQLGENLPIPVACRIVMDVLCGLHAAHELTDPDGVSLNLVHRDVSPQNILVSTDGITRLTDFGVARAEARLAPPTRNLIKGKPCYMAPEQTRGEAIDRRADVYAAGIVLWEALAGCGLFQAGDDAAVLLMISCDATRSPLEENEHIPAEIADVCMRALASSPDERYETAVEFADALDEAVAAAGLKEATTRDVAAFLTEFQARVSLSPQELRGASNNVVALGDDISDEATELLDPDQAADLEAAELEHAGRTPSWPNDHVITKPPRKRRGGNRPLLLATGLVFLGLAVASVLVIGKVGPFADSPDMTHRPALSATRQPATVTPVVPSQSVAPTPTPPPASAPPKPAKAPSKSAPSAEPTTSSSQAPAPSSVPRPPRPPRTAPKPHDGTFRPNRL